VKKLLLIKIGGGVITDKNVRYGLREDVLGRLAREVAVGVAGLSDTRVIVGNGAGSFAHWSASEYGTKDGFSDARGRVGAGRVRHDAVRLNQNVVEALLNAGLPAFSFSPSSMMKVEAGVVREVFMESLMDAFGKGLLPVVYGDVVVDGRSGATIFSTERVFEEFIQVLRPVFSEMRVIHVSSEDGVYHEGKASIFGRITRENFAEVKSHLGGSNGVDVTGGMLHKVEESLTLASHGVGSLIVSGLVEGRVRGAILGERVEGTIIG